MNNCELCGNPDIFGGLIFHEGLHICEGCFFYITGKSYEEHVDSELEVARYFEEVALDNRRVLIEHI